MLAIFRADASAAIGGGHAMRCLTLAQHLQAQGWHCAFAVNPEAAATVPGLRDFELETVEPVAERQPAALRKRWAAGADWLVVDHYGLDAAWESQNRGWARRILAIDDLADRRHDCDVLLDQTFARSEADYRGLVPETCRILTGSRYALLRQDFALARPASLARRQGAVGLRRLLVSLGATDPENYSLEALRGIAASGLQVTVDLVLGAGAPHIESLRREIAGLPLEINLHVDTRDMPALMAAADLAIGAAGTSTWERCCLGLPSLLVVIAENQKRIAENVAAANGGRLLPAGREGLAAAVAEALSTLARQPEELGRLASGAAEICDGQGTQRVAEVLVTDTATTLHRAGEVSGR